MESKENSKNDASKGIDVLDLFYDEIWFYDKYAINTLPLDTENKLIIDLIGFFLKEIEGSNTLGKRKALRIIILNLIAIDDLNSQEVSLRIFTGNDAFSQGTYNKKTLGLTFRPTIDVLKRLDKKGYIRFKRGGITEDNKKYSTKITSTKKFENAIFKFLNKEHIENPLERHEYKSISRRDIHIRQNDFVYWKDTSLEKPHVYKTASKSVANKNGAKLLKDYHALLQTSQITLGVKEKVITPFEKIQTRRFYDKQCNTYGRLHGGIWQNMPQEARHTLKLNGYEVVEVDISSTHPLLAYSINGIDLTERYQTEGKAYSVKLLPVTTEDPQTNKLNKRIAKQALICLFNAKSQEEAEYALMNEFMKQKPKTEKSETGIKRKQRKYSPERIEEIQHYYQIQKLHDFKGPLRLASEILNQLMGKHNDIKNHFFNDGWKYLCKQESDICMGVIEHFTQKNIPCLTVHESFIVPIQYKQELFDIAFEQIKQGSGIDYQDINKVLDVKEKFQSKTFQSIHHQQSYIEIITYRKNQRAKNPYLKNLPSI